MTHTIRMSAVLLFALGCAGDDDPTPMPTGDTGMAIEDVDMDGVAAADDCDDNDDTLGAVADDGDCDGILTADDCDDADAMSTAVADDADCDGILTADDCDDADDMVAGATDWFADADGDGFGEAGSMAVATECIQPMDTAGNADDCDDADADISPDAPEIPGNTIDENCDTMDTANLVLNEIHYDPVGDQPETAAGEGGDANYNFIREAQEDEFVEIINASTFAVDVSGFQTFDAEDFGADPLVPKAEPSHAVPAGTIIMPGQAFVIFGGSMPGIDQREFLDDAETMPNPNFGLSVGFDFGGATVQAAAFALLNLNNGGDTFFLNDAFGNNVITQDITLLTNFDSGADQSYTRNPDVTGDFDQHTNVVTDVLFSPGTRSDGTAF